MRLFLLLSLLLSFAACKNRNISDTNKIIDTDKIVLANSSWYIISISGVGKELIELPGFKISFGPANYSLKLDVNSCNGSYSQKDNEVKFNEDLSCTKMCCDGQGAESLKGLLNSNYSIEKSGSELILKNGAVSITLSDKEPVKSSKLNGKSYVISKVMTMGKEIKPKAKLVASFNTNDFGLQLDANSCGSECQISDDQISFSATMACTEMCCDSEESQKIARLFNGKMQYIFEDEMLVIFDKNNRIWLTPQKEKKEETKTINAADLIGKDFKIYDIEKLPQGPEARGAVAVKYAFDYIVSFKAAGFAIKLDINSCNTSATYSGNAVEISSGMGCTKMCCDSQESDEVKKYFKGRFEFKQVGEYLIMSNSLVNIRLLQQK